MAGQPNLAVPSKRGGKRAGAGRKRTGKSRDVPHRKRQAFALQSGIHVVMRVRKDVARLRKRQIYEALRREMTAFLGKPDFRIVHLSIQSTHIHLIVEASDDKTLSNYMRSMSIRFARAINKAFERTGPVFVRRYYSKRIVDERHAFNTLAYVLNNWRHHSEDWRPEMDGYPIDPYSSAIHFDGWTKWIENPFPESYKALPVSPPKTALLSWKYQYYGLVDPFESSGGRSEYR